MIALLIPGIWLSVAWSLSYPGAALGGSRAGRRARALVPAGQGPLVADVRRAARDVPARGRHQRHPRRAAGGDAHRLDGQRGGRGRLLHDHQHALVADHAAALRGRADRPLLRPAGAQGGLRPAAARARRRARRHERAGGRRVERARRLRAAAQPQQGGGFAPPAPPEQGGGFAPPQAPGTSTPPPAHAAPPAACRAATRSPRRPSAARATERPGAEPPRAAAGRGGPGRRGPAGRRALDAVPQSGPDAAQARARAREILHERRFRGSRVPRPFAGLLRWLGDRVQPVADFIDDLAARIPGGRPVVFLILSALVLLAAGASRAARSGAARPPPCAPPAPAPPRATIRRRSSARPTAPRRPASGRPRCACASAQGCCGSTRAS